MSERCWCEKCHEYKVRYTPKYSLCQKCYREVLVEYSYYRYKAGVKKPDEMSTARKICDIAVSENLRPKKVVEKYGEILGVKNNAYVRSIMTMYLERCDTMGKPKPKHTLNEVEKIG